MRSAAKSGWRSFTSRIARAIASKNRGPAPTAPVSFFVAKPLALPTHTTTVRSRVKPAVHASRNAVLVPVFTDTG